MSTAVPAQLQSIYRVVASYNRVFRCTSNTESGDYLFWQATEIGIGNPAVKGKAIAM
jgi:hypothetical protein